MAKLSERLNRLAPSATVAFTVANPDAGARRADRDKEPDG